MILSLLVAAAPVFQSPAASESANEVRAYDLRSLRVSSVTAPATTWGLAPQGLTYVIGSSQDFDDSDGGENELFFPGLIADLLDDELSFEGRRLEVLEDGTLLLIGPASLHSQVQRIYDFLLGAASERIELLVEVSENPSFQSGSSVEGGTARYLVSLPAAVWSQVRSTEVTPALLDYDVEIAQSSAIGDPIVVGVESGLRLHLQAVPAEGGIILSTILRRGKDARIRDTKLGHSAGISAEQSKMQRLTLAEQFQSYSMWNMGSGGAAFLPRDGKVTLQATFGDKSSRVTVSHVGGELLARRELVLPSGGSLVLLNEHSSSPSKILPQGCGLTSALQYPFLNNGSGTYLGVGLQVGAGPQVHSLIGEQGYWRKLMVANYGPWRLLGPRGNDFASALKGFEQQVAASARAPIPLEMKIEFLVDGRTHASFGAEILMGSTNVVSVGSERSSLIDYDVEVAQFAAVADPTVVAGFDGLMGLVHATLGSDGRLHLRTRASGTWTAKERWSDLGMRYMDGIDQITQERLFVDERRILEPAGDGAWVGVFGAEGDRGASLRVAIRRP